MLHEIRWFGLKVQHALGGLDIAEYAITALVVGVIAYRILTPTTHR